MEDFKTPAFEKWVIIPVKVEPYSTAKIDFKLPGNVRYCTGIAFTSYGSNGVFNAGDRMGELSLSLNNRKSHLLNFATEYRTIDPRMDQLLMPLEEPLEGGSRVSGYYKNPTVSRQELRIYLQCIIDAY
jgi:hypothetical protein